MPEISFQAVIFSDLEPGTFRVLLRPYESNSARTYSAVMNAKRLVEFIASIGMDQEEVGGELGPKKAVVLEDVELEIPDAFAEFGFILQEAVKRQ
ncbi:MAG TPA: hypothetical protein VKL99_15125 [Candidatus Angelobacter sp.]|nr:hypothetical protein [Candidatus Angelobacter sp.]